MDSTEKANLITELTKKQNALEKEVSRAWGSYKKMKNKVDAYTNMLNKMEQDVARAEATSDSLRLIAQDLKQKISVKDSSISELETERENLNKTVNEGKALIASNFDISGFNKRGKKKEDEDDEFKSKNLEQLQVNFHLMPNPIADVETKTVYFLVKDPSGAVIYNTDKGSGEVEIDGEKIFYTLKQDVLYDRAGKDVTFLFEKGDEYQEGPHTVSIFVENKRSGETQFTVD
jgi:predicted RNase H-like nuclease (RuvC/YqgF family)